MKKLLSFILVLFFLNTYLIFEKTVITIPKIAILPWCQHFEYGVIPTPLNNMISQYIIDLRGKELVQDMQGEIYNSSIDSIYSLFIDDEVDQKDVRGLVEKFIAYGADINFKYDHSGCTPVRNLLANDMVEEANYLLSLGADLSISSGAEKNPVNICSLDADDIYAKYPKLNTTKDILNLPQFDAHSKNETMIPKECSNKKR